MICPPEGSVGILSQFSHLSRVSDQWACFDDTVRWPENETEVQGHCLMGLKWPGKALSPCKSLYTLKCDHSVETIVILLSVSECMDFIQTWSGMHKITKFHFFQGKCKHLCMHVKHCIMIITYRVLLISTIILSGTCICIKYTYTCIHML